MHLRASYFIGRVQKNVGDTIVVWVEGRSQQSFVMPVQTVPHGGIDSITKKGIPASSFKTDNWPLYDPENDVPVEQIMPKKPDGYV